ncbi:tyrosine-protein phosphatase Lar-like isoform X1 [Clavelina lepadiformis]|uniref:tyrosine-protein phosphatase Lar-like isoform X1 n=1 Tax=Clavelina lepadiformis TaxID=159417 RepID=UPI0040413F01
MTATFLRMHLHQTLLYTCKCYLLVLVVISHCYGEYTFQHNGFYISLFNDSLKTWDEAKAACEGMNGELVNILSQELQGNISEVLRQWQGNINTDDFGGRWQSGYYTSGRRSENNAARSICRFQWSNGDSISNVGDENSNGYQHWYRTEPNCGGYPQYCLAVSAVDIFGGTYTNGLGYWVDDECDTLKYYICQAPAKLLNATSTYPVTGDQFTLTCEVAVVPPTTVVWKINQTSSESNIPSDGSIFQVINEKSGDVIVSRLNVKTAGLCLGPSTISCWLKKTLTESKLHEFTVNQEPYDVIGESYYIFKSPDLSLTYFERENDCNKVGGNLASIRDAFTQSSLETKLTNLDWRGRAWIGLKRLDNGSWIWPSYEIVNYTNWSNETHPENWTDYGYMSYQDDWKWKNLGSGTHKANYICEVSGKLSYVVETQSCTKEPNKTLTVILNPSNVGLNHSITVSALSSFTDHTFLIPQRISQNNEENSKTFTNLKPRTKYNISVSLASEFCTRSVETSQEVLTGYSIPQMVPSATVLFYPENGTCLVEWKWPEETIPTLQNFVIQVSKTPSFTKEQDAASITDALQEQNEIINSTLDKRSNLFQTLPNRIYKIKIFAQSCAGDGEFVHANGECNSPRSVPMSLPELLTAQESNGDVSIMFPRPDETNGPISCYFLVGQYQDQNISGPANFSDSLLDELSLKQADAVEPGQPYLALAMPGSLESMIKVKVGDGRRTSCDVNLLTNLTSSQIQTSTRSRRTTTTNKSTTKIYNATNVMPTPNKYYSFYLVTSTPLDNGSVGYMASQITVIKIQETIQPTQDIYWLIGIAAAVILIVTCLVVFIYKRKRRSKDAVNGLPLNDIELSTQPATIAEPIKSTIYENVQPGENVQATKAIPLVNLKKVYFSLTAPGSKTLMEEFKGIKLSAVNIVETKQVAALEKHKKQNRYKNIVPYDGNRVILKLPETEADTANDYINASYIDSYHLPNHFIATQGPLDRTISHFWAMIWQKDCRVVVMVTKLAENGKVKCASYWPEPNTTKVHGSLTVTAARESVWNGTHIVRNFKMTNKREPEAPPRTITHFQYTGWPDHGVPITTTGIVRLHDAMIKSHEQYPGSPIVVHCSAGAGRTGTLIAIHSLIRQMQTQDSIDVYSTVMQMRTQRCEMVQTEKQYAFLYKVITEVHVCGFTDIDANDLGSKMNQLAKVSKNEFKQLDVIPPLQATLDAGNLNKKNDHSSCYEHSEVKGIYNAAYLQGYSGFSAFIASQDPHENQVNVLWKCVFDQNVSVIVALSPMDRNFNQTPCYWSLEKGSSQVFGDVEAKLASVDDTRHHVSVHKIDLTHQAVTRRVTHIHYQAWMDENEPDLQEIINVVTDVGLLHNYAESLMLVHCRDGIGRTGVFCALMNLIERLKAEHRIDVFRAVKDLRDMKPGMVPSVELYKLCFKLLQQYLSSFEIYSNFSG